MKPSERINEIVGQDEFRNYPIAILQYLDEQYEKGKENCTCGDNCSRYDHGEGCGCDVVECSVHDSPKQERRFEIVKCEHQGAGGEGITISHDSSDKKCCENFVKDIHDDGTMFCANCKKDSGDWEKKYFGEHPASGDETTRRFSIRELRNLIQKEKSSNICNKCKNESARNVK